MRETKDVAVDVFPPEIAALVIATLHARVAGDVATDNAKEDGGKKDG